MLDIVVCDWLRFDVSPAPPAFVTREVELATDVHVGPARILDVVEQERRQVRQQ